MSIDKVTESRGSPKKKSGIVSKGELKTSSGNKAPIIIIMKTMTRSLLLFGRDSSSSE
jgi:hypothetical protein